MLLEQKVTCESPNEYSQTETITHEKCSENWEKLKKIGEKLKASA